MQDLEQPPSTRPRRWTGLIRSTRQISPCPQSRPSPMCARWRNVTATTPACIWCSVRTSPRAAWRQAGSSITSIRSAMPRADSPHVRHRHRLRIVQSCIRSSPRSLSQERPRTSCARAGVTCSTSSSKPGRPASSAFSGFPSSSTTRSKRWRKWQRSGHTLFSGGPLRMKGRTLPSGQSVWEAITPAEVIHTPFGLGRG